MDRISTRQQWQTVANATGLVECLLESTEPLMNVAKIPRMGFRAEGLWRALTTSSTWIVYLWKVWIGLVGDW